MYPEEDEAQLEHVCDIETHAQQGSGQLGHKFGADEVHTCPGEIEELDDQPFVNIGAFVKATARLFFGTVDVEDIPHWTEGIRMTLANKKK